MNYSNEDIIADPILYRTYWSIMLEDILHKLGYDANIENKHTLHEFHKRIFNFKTTSAISHLRLSKFMLEVIIFWEERGIFVRSSRDHYLGMEDDPLSKLWSIL